MLSIRGVNAEGDYVDLSLNPERFTGYAGVSAQRVWSTIYSENCFGQSESESELSLIANPKSREATTIQNLLPADEDDGGQCLEKRVYYKIISGELCAAFCMGGETERINIDVMWMR